MEGGQGWPYAITLVLTWFLPLSLEWITLVSQKMCVVVYPQMDGGSGAELENEGMEEEQRQPMYHTKDKPDGEQA